MVSGRNDSVCAMTKIGAQLCAIDTSDRLNLIHPLTLPFKIKFMFAANITSVGLGKCEVDGIQCYIIRIQNM